MESVFYNGGIIGKTLDFGDTQRYVVSQQTISYVGSRIATGSGTTAITVSMTALGFQQGDVIIGVIAKATTGTGLSTIVVTEAGWTEIAPVVGGLFANDTYDANMRVYYKVMGATPDTTFTSTQGGGGATGNGTVVVVYGFRGVDTATPLDVAAQPYTLTNGYNIDLPAITPLTSGAVVVGVGAGASVAGSTATYSSSNLTNFITTAVNATVDVSFGMGWSSTVTDPAAWTNDIASSTANSAVGMTIALRPQITLGNLKNSGVWNVQAAYEETYSNYSASLNPLTFSAPITATGTATTTHTCTAVSPTATRLLIAAVQMGGATSSFISTVTIGGVAATRRAGRTANDFVQTDFWSAIVPVGTSVDVNVTRSAGTNGATVVLITASGYSNTNWVGTTDFDAINASTVLMDTTATYTAASTVIGFYRGENIQGTATRVWSGVNTLGSETASTETVGVNGAVAGDISLNSIQYQTNVTAGSRTVSFTTSDTTRRRPSFAVIGFN